MFFKNNYYSYIQSNPCSSDVRAYYYIYTIIVHDMICLCVQTTLDHCLSHDILLCANTATWSHCSSHDFLWADYTWSYFSLCDDHVYIKHRGHNFQLQSLNFQNKNGSLSSSLAAGLLWGSIATHFEMQSTAFLTHLFGIASNLVRPIILSTSSFLILGKRRDCRVRNLLSLLFCCS